MPVPRTIDLLTINEHERKHARLTKDVWNKMVLEANKYEGRYCSLRCGRIARRIVEAMLSKAASEIELVSFRFDDEQYGFGRNPKINNGIKGAGGAFDRNIAVLEVALQEFESEGCSLP